VLTFLRTLRFFSVLLRKNASQATIKTTSLQLNTALTIELDIYQEHRAYAGTILFIHGMNKHGKNDERVKFFCRCLASVGYRVLVPSYPAICQHNFDLSSIEEISQTIIALADNSNLCPKATLAIFTVSLTGTLAIKAAAQQQTYKKVSAFFTIGSAFYVSDVFRLGMQQKTVDSYMRMICIKNVLRNDPKVAQEIIAAIDVLIDDVFEPEKPNNLPAILPKLKPESKEFIQRIIDPNNNTAFLYERYQKDLQILEKKLFASGENNLLQFPIILIHSANDHVFPAEETIKFSDYLTEHKVKHDIFITTLMEHVNHDLSWRKLGEIYTMLKLFNRFFSAV